MKLASIGSVSHGTLRSEDLIPTLHDELESQLTMQERTPENRDEIDKLWDVHGRIGDECWDDAGEFVESENDSEIVCELCDALNCFAPAYCYFGAHEGDGADFGFWPSMDAIEEFDGLCVDDLADVPEGYAGEVKHVNDHGNVSIYWCDQGRMTALIEIV